MRGWRCRHAAPSALASGAAALARRARACEGAPRRRRTRCNVPGHSRPGGAAARAAESGGGCCRQPRAVARATRALCQGCQRLVSLSLSAEAWLRKAVFVSPRLLFPCNAYVSVWLRSTYSRVWRAPRAVQTAAASLGGIPAPSFLENHGFQWFHNKTPCDAGRLTPARGAS